MRSVIVFAALYTYVYDPLHYYPPYYAKVSLLVSTLEVYPPKFCENTLFLCLLRATSFSS